jgi:hypothetical protein
MGVRWTGHTKTVSKNIKDMRSSSRDVIQIGELQTEKEKLAVGRRIPDISYRKILPQLEIQEPFSSFLSTISYNFTIYSVSYTSTSHRICFV